MLVYSGVGHAFAVSHCIRSCLTTECSHVNSTGRDACPWKVPVIESQQKKQNHRISDGILIWMAPKKKGKKNQQTNILIYSNWAGMHLKKLHKKPNHTCFLFSKNSEVFLCWCQPVTFLALKAWTSGNTDGIHSSITSRNSTSLTIFQLQNPGNICTSLGWYLFWLA